MDLNQVLAQGHLMYTAVVETPTIPISAVVKNNMNDGNNLPNIYGKKSKGAKKVTAREADKSKRKAVPHGTSTNYTARGTKNTKVTKVKAHKKILTDGGYMYV